MSTDRELLELAAKADGRTDYRYIEPEMEKRLVNDRGLKVWNPLTDGEDSHLLMAKHRICIEFTSGWGCEYVTATLPSTRYFSERYVGDPLKPTKRAIVRAVAHLGRKMA